MRVKVYITLDIDPEEYPVPADQNVGQEIQETLEEYFYEIDGGVKMIDEVNYKLPFGFIGSIAHALFIKKKLQSIFDYREKVLLEMFGKY